MSLRITNRRIWVIIGILSLSWGTAPVAGRIGLAEGIGPPTMAAGMSLVAAGAVWLTIGLTRRRGLVGPTELRIGLVLAVIAVALPQQARYLALANASAGFVTLVNALLPLGVALLAHFMLADERLNGGTTLGLLVGLAGVAALVLMGDTGIADGGNPLLGGAMALGSVALISLASVYAKRYAGQYSVLGVTGVQLAAGSAMHWVLALVIDGLPFGHSTTGLLAILYAGTLGAFLPLILYYWLIRHMSVVYLSVVAYLIPLVAVIAGVLVLDERIQPGILVGGGLVLAGVVITDVVRIREARRHTV